MRADSRLDDLKWKEILKRYLQESFFGKDEQRDAGWARQYFEYVQTLGEFAREISQIEAASDTEGMEARLAPSIDAMIDYAAESAKDLVTIVNRDDKRAETTFRMMIDAYIVEFRATGIDTEELNNTLSDYWVASRQVSNPVSRNANRVRAELAENRAKRQPGYKSPEQEKAEQESEKLAAKQNESEETKQRDPTLGEHFQNSRRRPREQPQPETMASNDSQSSAPKGEVAEIGSGPPESFGPRRGPRFGPPSGFGPRPSFGQPRGPGGSGGRPAPNFDGPDRIEFVINGGRNPRATVEKFVKRLGIQSYSYRGTGGTAKLITKDSRSAEDLAAEIDFGEITSINGRVITVQWNGN